MSIPFRGNGANQCRVGQLRMKPPKLDEVQVSAATACTRRRRFGRPESLPFWAVHLAAVGGVVWTGWSWTGLALALALYYGRMFFVTAGKALIPAGACAVQRSFPLSVE